jgi:arylsulfatase A-like enzyme
VAYSHNGYTIQSRRHIFSGSPADIDSGTTLVDDFKAQGYETAYFSAQDESFGGPDQGVGFERADVAYDARTDRDRRYSTFTTAGSLAVSYEVLGERVAEFLRARKTGRPLFLYVNFHDTHFPYHHEDVRPIVSETVVPQSDISPARAADVRVMYLNTAANVDRAIGRLLEDVARALGHDAGVVVLADHGESLFDEGFLGHGYALNDAQTRIPLVVAGLPLTILEPFGQADLRGALHRAFSDPTGRPPGPVLVRESAKTVFQYLGNIDRPAAIGLTGAAGRLVYDMRARTVQVGGGPWLTEGELSASQRRDVADLIHAWERMVIARRR